MPGAGPWQDERHRFRRGDKGPTLPPRGYAAPSPSSRGGPGTGSNLRDLTSKDGDVLRARFPAGGSTSNILPKGLPVFRVHSPFPFCTSATGQLSPSPVVTMGRPKRVGSGREPLNERPVLEGVARLVNDEAGSTPAVTPLQADSECAPRADCYIRSLPPLRP